MCVCVFHVSYLSAFALSTSKGLGVDLFAVLATLHGIAALPASMTESGSPNEVKLSSRWWTNIAKENIGKRRKSIFLDDWSAMKCRFKFGTYHFALFEVALFFQGDFLLLDCSWFLADFQLLGSCSRSQNHMVWECLGYLGTGQILVIFLVKSSKLNKIEKHEFRVEKHNLTRQ